jgi:hypothetical protein
MCAISIYGLIETHPNTSAAPQIDQEDTQCLTGRVGQELDTNESIW